jgi:hypothetical protein
MTLKAGGRGRLIKGKQDKRSQNQSRNCLSSNMRCSGILTTKHVMVVVWKKKSIKTFKPTVLLWDKLVSLLKEVWKKKINVLFIK